MSNPSEKPTRDATRPPASSNGNAALFDRIREQLIAKRDEIARQRAHQLDELLTPDKHHLADLEEMSGDTVDTDSMCALVDMESNALGEIEAALEKLDQGTYGICEDCENAIPPQRLEVLPFTSVCIDCKRQRELRGE